MAFYSDVPAASGGLGSVTLTGTPSAGQVITATSSSAADWEAAGAASVPDADATTKGKVQLTGNLGGTAAAPTVVGLTIPSEAQGDVIYRGATDWVRLGAGTAGRFLKTGGAAANPSWSAIQDSDASTKGVVQLAGDLGGTGTAAATPRIGTLTGVSGVVTGPATAITIGSAPASAGGLRIDNAMSILAANHDGSANLRIATTNSSDVITYGGTVNSGLVFGTATAGNLSFQVNAVEKIKLDTSGLTIPAFSSAGVVHNSSAGVFSSSLLVDADVSGSAAVAGTKIAPAFGTQNITFTGFMSVGATPASAGDVRLSKASSVKILNNAGSGDINAFSVSAGDVVTYGGTVNSGIVVGTATGAKVSLTVNAVEIAKVDGSGITVPAMSTAGLVHNSSAGLFSSSTLVNADVSASAAIAYSKLTLTGSVVNADVATAAAIAGTKVAPDFGSQTVVTTGVISAGGTVFATTGFHAPNNVAAFSITNGAAGADLTVITSNNSNTITFGSVSSGTTQIQASTTVNIVASNTVAFAANSITLGSNAADKTINQGDKVTNGGTGQKLTIRGQNETGTTSTGGDFEIGPGTGTSTNGNLRLINMTVTGTAPSAGASTTVAPEGYATVYINGTARKIAYYL